MDPWDGAVRTAKSPSGCVPAHVHLEGLTNKCQEGYPLTHTDPGVQFTSQDTYLLVPFSQLPRLMQELKGSFEREEGDGR